MDGKTSSKLSGLISKLTAAANKAVAKKEEDQKQYTKRPMKHEFSPNLNITQLNAGIRTA